MAKLKRWILVVLLMAGGVLNARALTLDDCVAAALELNAGMQAAGYRVEAARAARDQASAACYPRIFASGQYARTDNPTQAFMMELNQRRINMADPGFDPNDPDDADNLRVGLGVQYRLFDGGRRGARHRMAAQGAEAARAETAAVHNDLVYEVTHAYYFALKADALLAVHNDTIASIEESLRVAREKLRAGSAIKTDVLNLEVQQAQAYQERIRARHGLTLAVAALNTAIGAELADEESIRRPAGLEVAEVVPDAGESVIERRPELRAAGHHTSMQAENLRHTRGLYAPTVNAFGSLDWDSDTGSGFERSYMMGVVAELDLFDGFLRSRKMAEARARLAEARARQTQIRRQLEFELKQAALQAESAGECLQVAAKIFQSAEEVLRITKERYEQGAVEITELMTAQAGLTDAGMRRTAAYYDYLIARANVARTKGMPATGDFGTGVAK